MKSGSEHPWNGFEQGWVFLQRRGVYDDMKRGSGHPRMGQGGKGSFCKEELRYFNNVKGNRDVFGLG